MKFLMHITFYCLFIASHSLIGAQPKQEKRIIYQEKNNLQLKKQPTAGEIKENEKNAEEYRKMIAALGGEMPKAKL